MMKKTYVTPATKVIPMGMELPVAYTRVQAQDENGNTIVDWGGEGGDGDWGSVKGNVDLWSDEW